MSPFFYCTSLKPHSIIAQLYIKLEVTMETLDSNKKPWSTLCRPIRIWKVRIVEPKRGPHRAKVEKTELVGDFRSIQDATKQTGLTNIHNTLSGKNSHCQFHVAEYIQDIE